MSASKLLVGRVAVTTDPVSKLAEGLSALTTSKGFSDKHLGTVALATESISVQDKESLTGAYNSIEATIKSIASDMGFALESHQLEAATMAGIVGTTPREFIRSKPRQSARQDAVVLSNMSEGSTTERPAFAMEAYSDVENKNAQLYSILFNLLASKQDEFGETLFPTIVMNPNEIGVTVLTKLFYVYNDFKRATTGALANYARKSVIRAYADSNILKNDATRLVPVLRTGGGADDNSARFVSVTDVPGWTENVGANISIPTGALKTGQTLDMMGICQFNELVSSGLSGPSDTIHPAMKLKHVFVKFTDGTDTDIVRIAVDQLPSSTFTYAPQGNTRRMILNLDSDALVLGNKTKKVDGAALTYLTELDTNDVRVQLTISGNATLDKGDFTVSGGELSLTTMRNAAGSLVTGAGFSTLAAKFASAEVIGFTVKAYRENASLRQRPLLLDTQSIYNVINVPYLSPFAVLAPVSGSEQDTSAVSNLISVVGVSMSNRAVTALIDQATSLRSYVSVPDVNGELPHLESLGSMFVKPQFFSETINLETTVDSVKSHERSKDIRAALVEKIRYYANEMYRKSEYQAGSALLTGNLGTKPVVIVATDPVLHNYIMADGDLRTLGENFDVKVVSTINTEITNKIFVTFGVFDSSRNSTINPLNSGNMLYAPEVTVQLPISRDGQVSNELIVTPRFSHVWHLPVLTELTVTGLPTVTSKVTVNTKVLP